MFFLCNFCDPLHRGIVRQSQSIHTLVDMFQYNRTVGKRIFYFCFCDGKKRSIKIPALFLYFMLFSYVLCLRIQLPELCTLVAFCNVFNCDDIQLKDSEQQQHKKEEV